MCLRSTEPPLLPNPCYAFVLLLLSSVVLSFYCVVVRWLGSSFAVFCLALCVWKNCKCATKCVGYFFFICPILGTIVIKNLWFAVPMSGCVRGIPFSPLPAIIISQFFNLSNPMLFDSQNFVNDCAL